MFGLLTKRIAVTLLIFFILLSGIPLSQGANSVDEAVPSHEVSRYRTMSNGDLVSLMSEVGVYDPTVNYNVIIDGMGTGLAPPTAEEWTMSLGQAVLDIGADDYEVPTASSMDLSSEPYFPKVGNQGSEGSCAAFSLTYYNYGYIEARDQGWSQAKTGNSSQLLSPSWTYNKVNGVSHEGSSLQENARIITQMGAATWATYPYLASDDEGFGNEAAWRSAPAHRISTYVNVYNPSPTTVVDLIKEQLGLNRPISFAMDAGQYTPAFSDGNKIMSSLEYVHKSYTHAQTVVGYDDAITDDGDVGAFKVANSWGSSWGLSGYYYVTYSAIKEMLGFPMVYLMDIPDYQPSLLATWTFTQSTSVDTTLEVGAGTSTAPHDKVSTSFKTGSTNRLPAFMAIDATALYDEYIGGEDNYYLKVGSASSTGTVSSFSLELYSSGYVPGSPSGVIAQSIEVPKTVPGVVNAVPMTVDTIAPTSEVLDLTAYLNSSQFVLHCTSSDLGGSGVDHLELYYRFNNSSYVRYAPSTNPSGEWTGNDITFNINEANGQGPYQFYSVAVDDAGNRETAPMVADAATMVDAVAPITAIVKNGVLGANSWFVSTVSVTMSAYDRWSGIGSITYRSNGGSWKTYASPLTLAQGTYALEFYAVDGAGNREAVKSGTVKVDTAAPTVYADIDVTSVNGWYRSSVVVSLRGEDVIDPDVTVEYRLDGGNWAVYNDALLINAEGEHRLEYKATDDAGNGGVIGAMDVNIDRTAPISVHSLQGQIGTDGRYTTAVNVTLITSDAGSGVDAVMYRLDGGEWLTYAGTFSMVEDGSHTLEYYAVDMAGNQGAVAQVNVIMDSQGPAVELSSDPISSNGWFHGTVTLTLTSEDHFDQGCPVFYRLNGGEWTTYASPFSIDQQGWHLLEYYAVDLAGNQGVIVSKGIGVDLTAPICDAALQGTIGLNDICISKVSVTLSTTDDGSGIEAAYYRINGGAWNQYQGTFTVSGEGSNALEYYAVDRAGNSALAQSLSINIDTKAPVVTATTDREATAGWFNSTVSVTLTAGASDVGCAIAYRMNGGEWSPYLGGMTVSTDGSNVLEWFGTDRAGNQGPISSRAISIDRNAPECSVTLNGTEGSNGYFVSAVEITLTVSDQGSGIGMTLYRLDGGEWAESSSPVVITEDGDHILEIYGEDLAGNSGDVLVININIDTCSPDVSVIVMDEVREDHTYLNDATVRFLAEDDVSGVAAVRLSLDGSVWSSVAGDVLVEGEGPHVIRYFATDLAGNNASVQEVVMEISLPVEAPAAVQGLTATIVDNGVRLQWSPSSTDLESRYLVYRSVDGVEELIANITGTSYLDDQVVAGEKYDYRVVPLNVVGSGPSCDILGLVLPERAGNVPYLLIAAISLALIGAILLLIRRMK